MRATWLGHDGGDHDGKMAIGVELGRRRRQYEEDFDQLAELRLRRTKGDLTERIAEHQRTLAYMRKNGIEITDDPASKWLPLQRKQVDLLSRRTGLVHDFGANILEVTRKSPRPAPPEPQGNGPAAPGT
jgi:hypothetical protein